MTEQPVIAIVDEDAADCQTIGYQLDANGEWQAIIVDETFAQNNLVWVVSANERVNNKGEVDGFYPDVEVVKEMTEEEVLEEDISSDGMPSDKVVSRGDGLFESHIAWIQVWDRKECWYCGRADASINGAIIKTMECSDQKSFHHKNFENINRWEVGDMLDCTKPSKSHIPESGWKVESTHKLGFVWYEKDWVNPQSVTLSTCSSVSEFSFKLKDSPWGVQDYSWVWYDVLDSQWRLRSFGYPSAVNQPKFNKIWFRWRKMES